MKHLLICLAACIGLLLVAGRANAQMFGQNKPRYRTFDFKILETPHFSIYHYTKNKEAILRIADWSEEWYGMHSEMFKDSLLGKNPIIFYNNHAEFQQTNAISGEVGVSTGGVTEGLKNRVVMPFTMINQQTQHVLGHELVHAFQFDHIINGDSTSLESLGNLPLWVVEGMAEYYSIGRVDPFTAMWMRDAVLNDDVPTLRKMNSFKYFPYRYGHAFWAFYGGTFGDQMILPFFNNTAKYGLDGALAVTLGIDDKKMSEMFINTLKTYYTPFLGENNKENFVGKKIISEENAGRMNLSPVISPDGRFVIFLSDKNLFSTDLYLADAREGKILRKLNSIFRDGNVDDLNLLESAGTWSPDSKRFAYVAFSKGKNVIIIKDPANGTTDDQIRFNDITSVAHPTWSPDGKNIAFTGMVEGQTDLFVYNLKSKKTTQLTNDFYSEVYPDYSPDGKFLVFSSDRKTFEQKKSHGQWNLHLSRINLEDFTIKDYDEIFPGADCLNPCYDPEGKVYFISDRDGFRNLYRYDLKEELLQMTDLKTGISGISKYSPAISVSKKVDKIAFTHYYKSSYDIYQTKADRFLFKKVYPEDVHFEAGTLPGLMEEENDVVAENIETMDRFEPAPESAYQEKPYAGNFKLDYIYSGGLGVSTGGIGTRTGLAGGVGMVFSDMLGNHQLYSTIAINGNIYDFGAAAQYINQKSRVGWGFSISHIPARAGYYGVPYNDTLDGQPVIIQEENILRVFEDQVSGLLQLPVNKNLRLEGSLGMNYRFFRLDSRDLYYNEFGYYLGESDKHKVPLDDEIIVNGFEIRKAIFYSNNIAVVGDKTTFGLASPINGYRFRFDYTNYFGGYQFQLATADMRYYRYTKPVTLAFRFMHYATLGPDSRNYYPVLIGDQGLVHGFEYSRLTDHQVNSGISPQQLFGSKFFVSGVEVRLPFTGPKELAVVGTNLLMSELSWFLDGGIAFNDYDELGKQEDPAFLPPKLVFSTGFSWRINLFGALVLEPFFAWPLVKHGEGKFGVYLVPGW
ncbi:MAG TPA: hypothetical protein VGK46_07005 [Saprospiraceae bacterium]